MEAGGIVIIHVRKEVNLKKALLDSEWMYWLLENFTLLL